MRISAKADYAVRAMLELAIASQSSKLVKGDAISRGQEIPIKFLENILLDLRKSGLIRSQRGAEGGYRLAHAPDEITIADIIRVVEGPLAFIRGERPEEVEYTGAAEHLPNVWIALRASIRSVLETVTLADVVAGELPIQARELTQDPDAWAPH